MIRKAIRSNADPNIRPIRSDKPMLLTYGKLL